MIRVIVRSEGRQEHTYHISTSATVDDVVSQWEKDSSVNSSSMRYRDGADGTLVTRQKRLSHLKKGESEQMEIFAEEVFEVLIVVQGVDGQEGDIVLEGEEAWPRETLGDLVLRFCENHLIDVESAFEHRSIEVSYVDTILDMDSQISTLCLKDNSVLCLRIPISLSIIEPWSDCEFLFEDVDTEDTCDEFRIVLIDAIQGCPFSMKMQNDPHPILGDSHGEIILSGCHTLGHYLKERNAPWKTSFSFLVDIPNNVWLLNSDSLRCMSVRPTKEVSSISGASSVLVDEVLQPPDAKLSNLNLEEDEVVSVDTIDISLRLTNGDRTRVVLPISATVMDLRQRAVCEEKYWFIRLQFGCRYLTNENESLIHAGVNSGSYINVERSLVDITVSLDGNRYFWQEMAIPLTYTTIEERLRSARPSALKDSDAVVFTCMGCGRKLSKEEEQYQQVPTNCCSKRSTELEVLLPYPEEGSTLRSKLQLLNERINELYKSLCDCKSLHRKDDSGRMRIRKEPSQLEMRNFEELQKSFSRLERINIAKLKSLLCRVEDSMAHVVNLNKDRESETLPQHSDLSQQEVHVSTDKRCTGETALSTSSFNQPTITNDLHGRRNLKLLIFYNASIFRPKKKESKKYDWSVPFIRCEILTRTENRLVTFKDMCAALDRVFLSTSYECTFGSHCGVKTISQMCGFVNGVEVTLVTSQCSDELRASCTEHEFCDSEGNQFSWNEVESRSERECLLDGDKIIVAGTGRRTVLWIHA